MKPLIFKEERGYRCLKRLDTPMPPKEYVPRAPPPPPLPPPPKKKVPALKLEGINYGDDPETWAGVAEALCKLKMSAEYAHQFSSKVSRYLQAEDRSELAELLLSFDRIYSTCWEKLIRKIRGL